MPVDRLFSSDQLIYRALDYTAKSKGTLSQHDAQRPHHVWTERQQVVETTYFR
jgi:hypothetical protein